MKVTYVLPPSLLLRPPPTARLVECEPADPITIHIMDYRASDGGWLRFSLKNVAGDAALVAVDIGTSTANGSQQEW